ncbi:MAG: substrate-binding domain-containing protein [Ruminococcus sp.]
MKKHILGVIAAQAADVEQREILRGIMEQAQIMHIDLAVFSNIYNPNEPNAALDCENEIYDLILSDELDGLILISEVIINTVLQQRIIRNLTKQSHIPIVVIGTPLPDFVLPHFRFINTSDSNDIEDITNHLIEAHGFTDIAVITGHSFIEASHLRVDGYRKALERHGIPFDENKVFFGDFWMNSGKQLAQKYIHHTLPLPQAIVCTNDYMAYGILDEFMDYDIRIPEDVTVVGYEYVRERLNHFPILTTYQRNRKAMGTAAVKMLYEKHSSEYCPDPSLFKGEIIRGNSCPCGISKKQLNFELKSAREKQIHDFLNLFSQFDHCLTECRHIYDFIRICHNFQYLIQNVQEVYLCLYDNWYENASHSDTMICYSIRSEQAPISFHKYEISKLFSGTAAAYYFNPLFFAKKAMGYVVLKSNSPDAYDYTFRNWLKSVSNGLEVLHMKNDIRYLTQCQNLSEQHDSLTKLYNKKGMETAYHTFKRSDESDFVFLLLKVCMFDSTFSNMDQKISAILDTAQALREFCGNHDICGRIDDHVFACFVKCRKFHPDLLADRLVSILIQKKEYMENYGMDSFICLAARCSGNLHSERFECNTSALDAQMKLLSERRILPHYEEMLKVRNTIYSAPEQNFSLEDFCNTYSFSCGHFRALYKKCFQISFHQDCINSKLSKAKFLLCTTNLNIQEIAKECGYNDEKYFLRQFSKTVGYTPHQYRSFL